MARLYLLDCHATLAMNPSEAQDAARTQSAGDTYECAIWRTIYYLCSILYYLCSNKNPPQVGAGFLTNQFLPECGFLLLFFAFTTWGIHGRLFCIHVLGVLLFRIS